MMHSLYQTHWILKNNHVAYRIVEVTPTNIAYTDLTGRFPYRSSRGKKYILVGCHYDGNFIWAEPLKIEQHIWSQNHRKNKHDFYKIWNATENVRFWQRSITTFLKFNGCKRYWFLTRASTYSSRSFSGEGNLDFQKSFKGMHSKPGSRSFSCRMGQTNPTPGLNLEFITIGKNWSQPIGVWENSTIIPG